VPGLHLRTVKCEFCGNQRSEKAASSGLHEQQYDQLLNFETSDLYDDRQKAACVRRGHRWVARISTDSGIVCRQLLRAGLVELGCCIALTFGQQSWIRLLGIDHQYMAGTSASMAPG
jgi:hypothetical protein